MVGRAAYETPWIFADVDRVFYGKKNLGYSRKEILEVIYPKKTMVFIHCIDLGGIR